MTKQNESFTIHSGTSYLTWFNFDGRNLSDPHAAIYVLNEQEMGKGEKGFEKVRNALTQLPHGTKLYIYPDAFVEYAHQTVIGCGLSSNYVKSVPFRYSDTLIQKLKQVTTENDIRVWYYATTPSEVTCSNKEDLRLSEKERDSIIMNINVREGRAREKDKN